MYLFIFIFFISGNNVFTEAEDMGRIVGGNATTIQLIPYIVSVQTTVDYTHECGGTIIGVGLGNVTWVVTAAHCTKDELGLLYVRVGSSFKSRGGSIFNVIDVIRHPDADYNANVTGNDIALLQLDGIITKEHNGAKLKLPKQDRKFKTGTVVRVSGWGLTLNPNESTEQLRTAEVTIIDHNECARNYSKEIVDEVTDDMICAAAPGVDSCNYDSGGPLAYRNQVLVGIVSWGNGCALANFPGVYVNVAKFRNWIRESCGI